jgi:hypothetical protein
MDRVRLCQILGDDDHKNGYACGYGKYVYVSKNDFFYVADVTNSQTTGPHLPDPGRPDEDPALGHGKAFEWAPVGKEPKTFLVLPSNSGSLLDASIYVIDVTNWSAPVLRGRVEGFNENLKEGRFYSAFVPSISYQSGPVYVWAAAPANACDPFPNCNDTVYIFDITPALVRENGYEEIDTYAAKWAPGCDGVGPRSPSGTRGHDVTVHGDVLLAADPGGGLYVVDVSDPLNPRELGRCEYPYAMTHDAWMSEDMDYIYTTDEHFLEWGCQRPIGDVTVYDAQTYGTLAGGPYTCNLTQVGKYAPSTAVTSHYCYINGDWGYVADYNKGLRILDVSNPIDPIEVGYYDTYLNPDIPSYIWQSPYVHGTVDVWPYYGDYISACDHDSGIFVLEFTPKKHGGCLSGHVRCTVGQSPVEGAWVYSQQADRGGISDSNGYYELKTAQDLHTITASALGFRSTTEPDMNIFTPSCIDCRHDFDLVPNTSNLATAWNNGKKIGVDLHHCIHLVYQNIYLPHLHGPGQPSTASHSVTYAYSTDRGATWEFTEFGAAYYPSIAVGCDNVPHIVLLQHFGGPVPPPNEYLIHYWKDSCGQWQSEVIKSYPDRFGVIFSPAIATDEVVQPHTSVPHVVWEYSEGGISKIYYWNPLLNQPEEVVTKGGMRSLQFPSIALDGAFTPHVLWQENRGGLWFICHSYREGDDQWHNALTVASSAVHPCADECEGTVYATWEEGSPSDVFIGRFTGAGWEKCPVCQTIPPSQFPVLEDSNVVWTEPTPVPGNYEVLYSKWDGSGLGFGLTCGTEPQNLSQTSSLSIYPQGSYHSFTDCSRFYVVWTEDLYNHQRLLFAQHVPAQ